MLTLTALDHHVGILHVILCHNKDGASDCQATAHNRITWSVHTAHNLITLPVHIAHNRITRLAHTAHNRIAWSVHTTHNLITLPVHIAHNRITRLAHTAHNRIAWSVHTAHNLITWSVHTAHNLITLPVHTAHNQITPPINTAQARVIKTGSIALNFRCPDQTHTTKIDMIHTNTYWCKSLITECSFCHPHICTIACTFVVTTTTET